MGEYPLAEASDFLPRIRIVPADGRTRRIAAGHDQHVGHPLAVRQGKQQMVQRRVGQHQADRRIVRRHEGAHSAPHPPGRQHNRLLPALQKRAADSIGHGLPHGNRHIFHHNRKGLHRPALQLPQPGNGRIARRVTDQMKAPNALHRHNAVLHDKTPGLGNRRISPLRPVQHKHLRPAVPAADRLGVEAAAFRIPVFPRAGRAHGKGGHAGALAVVGHGIQNGKPWTAGRAVDEGMQIAPVSGVKELFQAARTDADVRRNQDVARLPGARHNGKTGGCRQITVAQRQIHHQSPLRGLVPQPGHEVGQRGIPPLGKDLHPGAAVGHAARDSAGSGQAVHKGPEAHALDNTTQFDFQGFHRICSRFFQFTGAKEASNSSHQPARDREMRQTQPFARKFSRCQGPVRHHGVKAGRDFGRTRRHRRLPAARDSFCR